MKILKSKWLKIVLAMLVIAAAAAYKPLYDGYTEYRKTAVPVLEYHSVGGSSDWPAEIIIDKDAFEQQLAYLQKNGYRMISMEQMIAGFKNNEDLGKAVVLTFDDGYMDNYTNVFPLLQKYGANASFFIVQSKIGKPNYMGHDEIMDLIRAGNDLGSHTINHHILTDIDPKYFAWELSSSKFFLKKEFDMYYVHLLSYPNGQYDDEVIAASQKYGYNYAVTGKNGAVDKNWVLNHPMEIGRVIVKGDMDEKAFADKLERSYLLGYLKSVVFGSLFFY